MPPEGQLAYALERLWAPGGKFICYNNRPGTGPPYLPRWMNLRELIKPSTFAWAAQEALLNIMVTHSWLVGELPAAMTPHGVTPVQYNVLRTD